MPAPGDQHLGSTIPNPFEEAVPHIKEYTAREIATLQSRLEKQLGPEFISQRAGPGGGRVHYLAAEKAINLANEVFGFNGWSSSIQRWDVDFVDIAENTQKVTLGMSVVVRITLRDGTYHEDVGYGHIENCKGKAAAFEKARKEAVTDALKRALRNFGKVLGNCLYDKEYLQKVTKIKVPPQKWDELKLHRHPDYAPAKKDAVTETKQLGTPVRSASRTSESGYSEFEDDFGAGALFDGVELAAEDDTTSTDPQDRSHAQEGQAANQGRPQGPQRVASMPAAAQTPGNSGPDNRMPPPTRQQPPPPYPPNPQQRPPQQINNSTPPGQANGQPAPPPNPHAGPPLDNPGFVSSKSFAKNKDELLTDHAIAGLPKFNPAAESPSIKRTAGIDHTKSAAVGRALVGQAPKPELPKDQPPAQNTAAPQRAPQPQQQLNGQVPTHQQPQARPQPQPNFVNPAADPGRRIGMPMGGNRSPYRPHSGIKRPHPNEARTPLSDVSNVTGGGAQSAPAGKGDVVENGDPKRAKVGT